MNKLTFYPKLVNGKEPIIKIISGGQTGVDRGALNASAKFYFDGVQSGGWCPLGRLAEDGEIPARYQLTECTSRSYSVRTELNIICSEATLIMSTEILTSGSLLTKSVARKLNRPVLVLISSGFLVQSGALIRKQWAYDIYNFVSDHKIKILNVAGPRESKQPGIEDAVEIVMTRFLQLLVAGAKK